jgi:hypothetical protein
MPHKDSNIITELDNLSIASGPSYYYGTLALDSTRTHASQILVLFYYTTTSGGTAVADLTLNQWYDAYRLPTSILTFNQSQRTVTIGNTNTVTFIDSGGTTRTMPTFNSGTKVRILRSQDVTLISQTFAPGSRVTSDGLNNGLGQVFKSVQELEGRLSLVEGATFEDTKGLAIDGAQITTGVVPVIRGGTGASTAGAARTALGVDNASNLTTGTIPNARITALPKTNILAASDDIINRTVGTASNNVVALDVFGKLPAVDGSNLFNLPSTGNGTGGLIDSVAITAGNGLDVTQSTTLGGDYAATLSADLKANGGIVIESTELAVDLGASSITGTLGVSDGGTGLTSISTLLNSNTTKGDVGLGNVENTALSTFAGSSNITTLGTIATGVWNGTTIAASNGGTGLTSISTLLNSNTTKADVGLGNVENTALSTWAGSGNITQVGTITSGTWNGTAIAYADVSGTPTLGTAAAAATGDFEASGSIATHNAVTTAHGISAFGSTLVDDADAAAARTTLGAAPTNHTHAQSEVTDLVTDLAAKSPLAGSSSIVTTGTITTGTWNATAIEDTKIDLRVDHGVTFDGQGSVIETAKTVYVPVERDGIIKAATLVGDASGSATITITKYDPAADDTTLGSSSAVGSISLSAKIINRDTTLSGWTTAVSEGDILAFTTGGTLATVTRLTCKLKMELA